MLPRASLLLLCALLAACGDDDASPGDAGGPVCTSIPAVIDTGMTAPRDATLDPATFDMATETDFDASAIPESATDFPIGVQSGAMTASSAIVWTRVGMGAETVLRVWRETDTGGRIALVEDATVTPDAAGYVHATVTDLAPATRYRYVFLVSDGMGGFTGRSVLGRFRTAFPDGMPLTMRVGATTCTGAEDPAIHAMTVPFEGLSVLASEDLDAIFNLGDMSYNDSATTIDEYRLKWADTLGTQGYRDLLPTAGMYITWDDHEVADNWDPETEDPARVDAARQAFFENLAIEPGPSGGIWNSYRWGDTAELVIMDLRSERRPSTLGSADPVFLSTEQMDFVKDRLRNSTAHFKLVFSSVNMTNLHGPWEIGFAIEDRWEGYVTQREELLDFIVETGIDNVWFLAGDIHVGFVGRLEPDGHRWARMWEITVGPGGSADNTIGELVKAGSVDLERDAIAPCNQFPFFTPQTKVATTLELDPLANTIRVRFVDAVTDEVLFDEVMQQEPPG